jgi:hypothetical protein
MKNQTNALKTCLLGAAVAVLGVGCATSGHARYDADADMNADMGVSASADVGTDRSDLDASYHTSDDDRAAAQATVSALGRTVDTRASWLNRHPFYDYNLRTMETYTFAAPDPGLNMASTDTGAPEFSVDLEPGSVYVEAAGGEGEVRAGRVIRHSPNPIR